MTLGVSTTPNLNHDEFFSGFGKELADQVWPKGVPDTEVATWLALAPDRRAIALKRVQAISDYESAGSRDAKRFAEQADVSLARFYPLLRKWAEARSISALVPYAGKRTTRSIARADQEVLDTVKNLVAEHPEASQETLARALFDQFKGRASLSYLRRLIAAERAADTRKELGGDAGFGKTVLIDASALDLIVKVAPDLFDWVTVGIVVDVATGMILGHATGRTASAGDLQGDASRHAVVAVSKLELPLADGNVEPKFVVVVPHTGNPIALLREVARLHRVEGDIQIVESRGTRHVGEHLKRAVGKRIGRLELRPRFTYGAEDGRTPAEEEGERAVDPEAAELIVSLAIAEHNASVATKPAVAAVDPSRIAEGLSKLYAPLEE